MKQAAQITATWLPMLVVALGQFLMSFNIGALSMSIGPMVDSFGAPPTAIGTAIVVYSLAVAAFIMLGAKLGQMFGSLRVFRIAVVLIAAAMALVAASPTIGFVIAAQGLAGLAAAALVPTLVVLITANYAGPRQSRALGLLCSAGAAASVLGFLVGGSLGTLASWHYAFALLVPIAMLTLVLSRRVKPVAPQPGTTIDSMGVVLAATAIILLSAGFETLNRWGLLLARPTAPFDILGLSPAPVLILAGIVAGQGFFAWARRRTRAGRTPLLALEVIESPGERAATLTLFVVVIIEACVSFLIPLYIMIVQGRSSLATGFAIMPFNLSVFFAAMLVVRLYDRMPPRRIARLALLVTAIGLAWLAIVIRNDWSAAPVILGLIAIGTAQGALMTLLFNVLVTASPRQFAGDVGSLRGTAINLAFSVGTAVAGALAVGLLATIVSANIAGNARLPAALHAEIDLDAVTFISNDQLRAVLARTSADPAQVDAALRLNIDARLQALKLSFLLLSGLALVALVPTGRLPDYHAPPGPADRSSPDTPKKRPAPNNKARKPPPIAGATIN